MGGRWEALLFLIAVDAVRRKAPARLQQEPRTGSWRTLVKYGVLVANTQRGYSSYLASISARMAVHLLTLHLFCSSPVDSPLAPFPFAVHGPSAQGFARLTG